MRHKGHDKKAAQRLKDLELAQFNLRSMPHELKVIRLRITQALRRDEDLKDLLTPAQDDIDRLLVWTDEAVTALSKIT